MSTVRSIIFYHKLNSCYPIDFIHFICRCLLSITFINSTKADELIREI